MGTPSWWRATALLVEWQAGEWAGLESRARSAAQEMSGDPGWAGVASAVAGRMALARGDVGGALGCLKGARSATSAAGILPGMVIAMSGIASIHLERGHTARARSTALEGFHAVAAAGTWEHALEVGPVAVSAAVAAGSLDEARELVAQIPIVDGGCHPVAAAARSFCEGLIAQFEGRSECAATAFADAHAMAVQLDRPYDAAGALERMAVARLSSGEPDGASSLLEALARFMALEAMADAQRVRRTLNRHSIGVPRPRRGGRAGRRGYGDQLSPREGIVVRMAGEGWTNDEIASALYLSKRTVENQLAAGKRKLGVPSRRALVILHQNGELPGVGS